MQLAALFTSSGVPVAWPAGAPLDVEVLGVTADSRRVAAGWVFVAVPGSKDHGIRHAAHAIAAGAVAIVLDASAGDSDPAPGAIGIRVADARTALGRLAAAWHGHPSRSLRVVGITGTNGKTTTAVLVAQLCNAAGMKAAAVGTLGTWTSDGIRPGALTTPAAEDLQQTLATLRDDGFDVVALEVSSHALDQGRVAGIRFAAAAWTNLTRDHLDYHGTLDEYAAAKERLFREYGLDATHAFVNADDDRAAAMWHQGLAQAWSAGEHTAAEHQLADVRVTADGLSFVLERGGHSSIRLQSPLLGRHNAENLTAAILCARAVGVADDALMNAARNLQAPRGRLEPVPNDLGALVLVDYAHSPDALAQVLATVRPLVSRGGRLLCVFGCGGDRDRGKRPEMGRIAARGADLVVATSDNPRTEIPGAILADIEQGFAAADAVRLDSLVPSKLAALGSRCGYVIDADREQAIRRAVGLLRKGDVLVIAGKGHETTQSIAGVALPFDDADVASRWLSRHRTGHRAGPGPAPATRPDGFAFDAQRAASATAGRIVRDGSAWSAALATDSRDVQAGSLFVALHGERFDANDFVREVARMGAAGIVCARGRGAACASEGTGWIVEVDDTLVALGQLAADHRRRFDLPVVGVTGSNGKTTTKELTALALHPLGLVLATTGNLNNQVGVPLTLAGLHAGHTAAVIEMGMSVPGEIERLAHMAAPRVGIVTSIGEAHLLGLGSLAAIAHEKAALLRALPADGVAIVPADEPGLQAELAAVPCSVLTFGRSVAAAVRLVGSVAVDGLTQRFRADVAGTQVDVELPGLGVHLCHNALGALAVAHACGVDVVQAANQLARYRPVGQRMLPSRIGPWLVLEDCYNANPRSMETALDTLAGLPRPQVAVVGSMLELGAMEHALHTRVGRHAAAAGIDLLIAVGPFARDYAAGALSAGLDTARIHVIADAPEAAGQIVACAVAAAPRCGTVLVKGSRGARMERFVVALREFAEGSAGHGGATGGVAMNTEPRSASAAPVAGGWRS